MAKEEKEEVAAAEPVKKKKPLVKIIIIAVVALAVVGGGVVAAMHFLGKGGAEKKHVAAPVVSASWPMEPFIVNLLDNQGERYLKVIMQLEVSDQLAVPELEQMKAKLRDNILDLLTAKTYAELMEMGGKQKLRDEVAARVNSYLTKGKITKVYFTEFVIQ